MKTSLLALLSLISIVCGSFATSTDAAPGTLDTSFDTTGLVMTDGGSFVSSSAPYVLAIQSDGKIVVGATATGGLVGTESAAGGNILARFTTDGGLDQTFGAAGITITPPQMSTYFPVYSLVIQTDGKIVTAGWNGLIRYTTDGSLDSTFGNNGVAIVNFGGENVFSGCLAMAIQADGKIVVSGDLTTEFPEEQELIGLARYNVNGTLDASFGTGGIVTPVVGGYPTGHASGVAIQTDGKLVVVGSVVSNEGIVSSFVVTRFNSNGSIDTSFGSGGLSLLNLPNGESSAANAVAIQNDGKIVVVGANTNPNTVNTIVRYDTSGNLDIGFGSNGVITISSTILNSLTNVTLQTNGKILVVGSSMISSRNVFALARYDVTGTPDLTFGTSGVVTTDFGSNFSTTATAAALQSDGKIVVTGTGADEFTLARYLGDLPPLIFIPGIAGSELDDSSGNQLWPTAFSSDILKLDLYTGSPGVVASDIIRTAKINTFFGQLTVQEVYSYMLAHLFSEGYTEFVLNKDLSRLTSDYLLTTQFPTTPNLFLFPYDWRQDLEASETTLHQYITNIRQLYGGQKVNVLAHSLGSLVIRRYVLDYGSDDIDHVVTVGGPFWGAPTAIYRLLAGEFFPELLGTNILNCLNDDAFTKTLHTFPGFQELLPSDDYLTYATTPVLFNGETAYTIDQYKTIIDQVSSPDKSIENNESFHDYDGNRQDDWSTDIDTIKYLHIYGEQMEYNTISGVSEEITTAFGWDGHPTSITHYTPIKDSLGDGVVAELSATRLPAFLSPQETLYKIAAGVPPNYWTDDQVEHTGLLSNTEALTCIDNFLNNVSLNTSPDLLLAAKNLSTTTTPQPAATSTSVFTQQVEINGIGYASIIDSLGNANTLLTDSAATMIPGLNVTYGGTQPTVDIIADSTKDFTISNLTTDPALEIDVTQFAQDGTPLSLRRYEFVPTGHKWQVHISAATGSTVTDPMVSIDTNNDGIFDTNEQIAPAFSSDSGPVDTTPPTLAMNQATVADSILVTLTAQDDQTASPTIRYTINDGAVQTYENPISLPLGTSSVLKAYAQDGAGNTSPLLVATIGSVPPMQHPAFFSGEISLTNGVYFLQLPDGTPFGYYSYLTDPDYIYHFDLGYEYVFDANDGQSGVYFYDFTSSDFFYTSPTFPFPYLFDFNLNSVVYYYPDPSNPGHYNTNGVRYFYDFNTGQIISK